MHDRHLAALNPLCGVENPTSLASGVGWLLPLHLNLYYLSQFSLLIPLQQHMCHTVHL